MKFKSDLKTHRSHHFPYVLLYLILISVAVWQIFDTLLFTAQMIRFRSLAAATSHKQAKLTAQIDQLKSQLVNKKAVSSLISSDLAPFNTPIKVYASISSASRVANLLP